MLDCSRLAFAVFFRTLQILLGVVLSVTVLVQTTRTDEVTSTTQLLAAASSVLFYVPLVIPFLLRNFTPVVVLVGELVTCVFWNASLVYSSYAFAYNRELLGLQLSGTSLGCSFLGLSMSLSALCLLTCLSIKLASKTSQWNCQDFFLCGGLFHKSSHATHNTLCEKQHADEEWGQSELQGKTEVSLFHIRSMDMDVLAIPSTSDPKCGAGMEESAPRTGEFVVGSDTLARSSNETSRRTVESDSDYSSDSDCRSSSSYDSLDGPSEVSTIRGDNSEIQAIPNDIDSQSGAGWRRCSAAPSAPGIWGE